MFIGATVSHINKKHPKDSPGSKATHIHYRKRPIEARYVHSQQVLDLRHRDVHSGSCGETSHQRLSQVNRQEAESQQTQNKLQEINIIMFPNINLKAPRVTVTLGEPREVINLQVYSIP